MANYLSYVNLCCAVILALFSNQSYAEEAQLKTAFILPLSGEWAFLGEGVKNGGLLAEREISSSNLSVSFEDNKGSLSESALIANRLVASESADVIISIISGVAQVVKPITSKAKLIQIGICSDSRLPDGKYNFTNYLTKEEAVDLYVKHFKETYGDSASLGAYVQNEAGFIALLNELKRTSKLNLKFIETFNGGDLDFKALVSKSLAKKPDVLLVMGLSPSLEVLVRQVRVLNKGVPLSSIEAFALIRDKSLLKGGWYVDAGRVDSLFEKKYQEAYSKALTPGVFHAYNSVYIAYQAYLNFMKKTDQKIPDNRDGFADEVVKINRQNLKKDPGSEKGVFLSGAQIRIVE